MPGSDDDRIPDEDEPACHAEVIAEHADRLARDQHTETDQSDPDA